MIETFRTMLKYNASFEAVDSNHMNVLEHAIVTNQEPLVQFILANKNKGLEIDHQNPITGNTAAHLCVKPLGFGSYENVRILKLLSEHGFNLGMADFAGKTALDYALEQESQVMARVLCRLMQLPPESS